jgi:flagellar protein FlbD
LSSGGLLVPVTSLWENMKAMIEVERVNGEKVLINPDQIQVIESHADSIITFVNREKMMVRTSPKDIIERIIEFRKKTAGSLPPVK